ncbi:hypothetical protein AB0B31_25570 [Catellatospora citrea]|uniref:hypothetical protein n=1 Tax=Catellatospora citrea TaxID=53366 RepID=UPI00340ED131
MTMPQERVVAVDVGSVARPSTSRFAWAALDELERADIHFRSATEPFDTSHLVGRMLVQMLSRLALCGGPTPT